MKRARTKGEEFMAQEAERVVRISRTTHMNCRGGPFAGTKLPLMIDAADLRDGSYLPDYIAGGFIWHERS